MTSFMPLSTFPIWDFYCDISDCHIRARVVNTCAQCVHRTNPCTKRKVFSLTKLKSKISKTKSLRNYITLLTIATGNSRKAWDNQNEDKVVLLIIGWLFFSLVNSISNFRGNLMSKLFLQKVNSDTIKSISRGIRGFIYFLMVFFRK